MTLIPVAEYRPDVADINTAYTDDMLNVYAAAGSYIPAPGYSPLSAPLAAQPLGAVMVKSLDSATRVFAGTTNKLWLLDNTTLAWDDVTPAGKVYNANINAPWSFAAFGNFVIAVNPNDDPQVYEIGTDTAFRDLGGNPPRSGIVKIWGDFVVLMQLTSNLNRVQWSGLNDAEFWTPGTNNSDYQDFPDGGVVQGSSEATNPIVFLQSAIYRATFVPGSLEIFTFQKIHDKRGAKSALSIATRGAFAFYADEGGFFQIAPDGSISAIGFEKVDRTVFRKLNVSSLSKIMGAVDPFYSRVYFALDTKGVGIYDQMLVYDWEIGIWTPIKISAYGIYPIATIGYTLERLDEIGSLDALPFSLDSKAWQGGAPILGAFSTEYRLGSFSGANLEAVVTSQEMADPSGNIMRTTDTWPAVDTDDVFVSVGIRMRRNSYEPVTYMPEQEPSFNTGRIRKRSRARFHRFRIRIIEGANWSHLTGIDVTQEVAGTR